MKVVLEKIVEASILNGYIKQEQYDEYLYGTTMLIEILINDITMLAIGLTMNMLWECVVFWITYKMLRKYCGGFHFSSSIKCYLSSCLMCPIILLSVRYLPYNMYAYDIIVIAAVITLVIISPVEAINKPLDDKEFNVFRRISIIIVLCLSIIYIVMIITNTIVMLKLLTLSFLCVALFVIVGKVQILWFRS